MTWKQWLIGFANAAGDGAASSLTGLALGIGVKKSAILLAASAGVSAAKWFLQHPMPGTPAN